MRRVKCCDILSNIPKNVKLLSSMDYCYMCDKCEELVNGMLRCGGFEASLLALNLVANLIKDCYCIQIPEDIRIILLSRCIVQVEHVTVDDMKYIARCDDVYAREFILRNVPHKLSEEDTKELYNNRAFNIMKRLKGRMNGLSNLVYRDANDIKFMLSLGYFNENNVFDLIISGVVVPVDLPVDDVEKFRYIVLWKQPQTAPLNWPEWDVINEVLCDHDVYIPSLMFRKGYRPKKCAHLCSHNILRNIEYLTHCPDLCEALDKIDLDDLITSDCTHPLAISHVKTFDIMKSCHMIRPDMYKALLDNVDGFEKIYIDAVCEITYVSGIDYINPTDENLAYILTKNKKILLEILKSNNV